MIQLAEIFQDGMVLQRGKKVSLWGTTNQPQHIQVKWNGILLAESTAEKGSFKICLPELEAACDGELHVLGSCGDRVTLKNVDIGEVWIAGGQSNMEFTLQCDKEGDYIIENAEDEHFRYYEVGRYSFEGESEEGLKDDSHWNRWLKFHKEHSLWFSAAGVYFAMKLRKELQVPVAVIGCNWGGTPAVSWIDEEKIRSEPGLKGLLKEYEEAVEKLDLQKYIASDLKMRKHSSNPAVTAKVDLMMKAECRKAPGLLERLTAKWYAKLQPVGPHDEKRPAGLFRTMVQKAAGYTCRGIIWYQGEADADHPLIYRELFAAVIHSWRKAWKEELPFLFVQLAPFESWQGCSGENFPILRQQQQEAEDSINNCWMVSIMDAGSRYDIHPKEKRPVGERLALLAMGKIYNMDVICEAPRIIEAVRQNGVVEVRFSDAGNILTADGSMDGLFKVESGGKVIPCKIELAGNCVRLCSSEITEDKKVMVGFAYEPYCRMTLFGKTGLPARPFAPVEI